MGSGGELRAAGSPSASGFFNFYLWKNFSHIVGKIGDIKSKCPRSCVNSPFWKWLLGVSVRRSSVWQQQPTEFILNFFGNKISAIQTNVEASNNTQWASLYGYMAPANSTQLFLYDTLETNVAHCDWLMAHLQVCTSRYHSVWQTQAFMKPESYRNMSGQNTDMIHIIITHGTVFN